MDQFASKSGDNIASRFSSQLFLTRTLERKGKRERQTEGYICIIYYVYIHIERERGRERGSSSSGGSSSMPSVIEAQKEGNSRNATW